MRDCDNCKLMRTGDCGGLECQGFVPLQRADPDILKAAQEAHDDRMHRGNKYGSRSVQRQAEAVEQARAVRSRQEPLAHSEPVLDVATRARAVAALRAWRIEKAREAGLPAYCIFQDATLKELASRKIRTKADLLTVRGVGSKIYKKYGDELFELLHE